MLQTEVKTRERSEQETTSPTGIFSWSDLVAKWLMIVLLIVAFGTIVFVFIKRP
jgi:hypothetical protein